MDSPAYGSAVSVHWGAPGGILRRAGRFASSPRTPLDAFGGLLLQAHMVQHLLLLRIAPPLLLLGQPVIPLLRGLPKWIFKDMLGPFLASRELKHISRALVK
jgi:cytochrome c oxidase assembly factor CtaG